VSFEHWFTITVGQTLVAFTVALGVLVVFNEGVTATKLVLVAVLMGLAVVLLLKLRGMHLNVPQQSFKKTVCSFGLHGGCITAAQTTSAQFDGFGGAWQKQKEMNMTNVRWIFIIIIEETSLVFGFNQSFPRSAWHDSHVSFN
jgi:hypothetical protein